MGIFSKKPPCAVCGGKVGFFLPTKIEDQYICDDCADKIDLPDETRNKLTMDSFKEYLSFYEQNRALAAKFQTSVMVDASPYGDGSVFDYGNRLFCMDGGLKKLIFEGKAVKRFTISEDRTVIYEGTVQGLRYNQSSAEALVRAMAPQAEMVRAQKRMEREQRQREQQLERIREQREQRGERMPPPQPVYNAGYNTISGYVDFKEPFQTYNIEIALDHPYYRSISFKRNGPRISNSDPDIDEYLNDYFELSNTMKKLAEALKAVAFPEARTIDGAAAPAEAQPVDAVSEIKKYKELLDMGIISQDEFDQKKKQLMGI